MGFDAAPPLQEAGVAQGNVERLSLSHVMQVQTFSCGTWQTYFRQGATSASPATSGSPAAFGGVTPTVESQSTLGSQSPDFTAAG